jgi:hypothetical protein
VKSETLYQDKLIAIYIDSILLKDYYYPSLKPKKVSFNSIEKIEVKQPSLWTGKWRIHGTGDFRTWFPLDSARYKRDRIFILLLRHKWIRIGFTAEDSESVQNIFREKGLLKKEQPQE